MILTIDAGNTNVAIGLVEDEELRFHWRLSSRTHRTADEVLLHLRELFAFDGVAREEISAAVISSVVPGLTRAIRDGVERLLGFEPLLVSADLELPVSICTEDPSEIGSDLLANAVAGYRVAGGAALIVDFGTALTFTSVGADGCVRGVAIAPGLSTSVDSLFSRTAALTSIDLTPPERYVGTNTTASLRSGIVYGYAGLVDAMVGGIVEELAPEKPLVLATGGEASLIAPHCRNVTRVEPWLTLRGLYEIGVARR
ncbi:MAG: type III pantothenate kinase [Spirochaetota bacterium]